MENEKGNEQEKTNPFGPLPWSKEELQERLEDFIVNWGETDKIDFKQELNISDQKGKAELLKDIAAIVNTYSEENDGYGFIIVGVKDNEIVGSEVFENKKEDNLKASIDQLIREYLQPFVPTQLYYFHKENKVWGAIIISPIEVYPCVFVKNIDNKYRGDVYVRRGSTTSKAEPEDYARFFGMRLKKLWQDFRKLFHSLESRVENLESIMIDKEVTRSFKTDIHLNEEQISHKSISFDLLGIVESYLSLQEDPIEKSLINEAQKIRIYLESELSWKIQIKSKEEVREYFEELHQKTINYWKALSKILLKDKAGKYDEAITRSILYLAHDFEAPIGVSFTDLGKRIRLYPLVFSLYLIFIFGAYRKKAKFLRSFLDINLTQNNYSQREFSIFHSLFFIRGAEEIFKTQYDDYPHSSWCDPVASYIKKVYDDFIKVDDFIFDNDANFFIGEFLLCLGPLDVKPMFRIDPFSGKPYPKYPSSGLYLYDPKSIFVLKKFLFKNKDWIKNIYRGPLEEILKEFDKKAKELVRSSCFPGGFIGGAYEAAFVSSEDNLF